MIPLLLLDCGWNSEPLVTFHCLPWETDSDLGTNSSLEKVPTYIYIFISFGLGPGIGSVPNKDGPQFLTIRSGQSLAHGAGTHKPRLGGSWYAGCHDGLSIPGQASRGGCPEEPGVGLLKYVFIQSQWSQKQIAFFCNFSTMIKKYPY